MIFFILYYGFLIGSFAVPFALIFFAPGKRSTFLLSAGLIYYALWGIQRKQENPDFSAIFDMGYTVLLNIIYGVIIAALIKVFILFRKGELNRKKWSYVDLFIVFFVVAAISGNFILGSSGVCLREGIILDDGEVFARYVVGRNWYNLNEDERKEAFGKNTEKMQLKYYDVQKKGVNFLGNYRINIQTYTRNESPSHSREYTEHSLTLNACGFYNGFTGSMGYTEEEEARNNHHLEKVMSSQSYNFK